MVKPRTCYIMIKDLEGDQSGLEYGVNYDLDEGETLPDDVEELTEAQYTTFLFVATLRGKLDPLEAEKNKDAAKDKPSGIIVPN